jgi:glycosyltransferase involved in cell wall biosynthesis
MHLRVEFFGVMDRPNQQNWDSFVNEHALESWVSRHPFVPREQAIRLMQQTQIQVLILGEGHGIGRIYPAKLFEYLGARRPILGLLSPGGAATLVQELDAGILVDPNDIDQVASAILEFYSRFKARELQHWPVGNLDSYERRYLTGQLASLLDDVVADK